MRQSGVLFALMPAINCSCAALRNFGMAETRLTTSVHSSAVPSVFVGERSGGVIAQPAIRFVERRVKPGTAQVSVHRRVAPQEFNDVGVERFLERLVAARVVAAVGVVGSGAGGHSD